VRATIRVVEDERKIRDLVRSCLEREGFQVVTTASGAEATTLAESTSATRYGRELVRHATSRPGDVAGRARVDGSASVVVDDFDVVPVCFRGEGGR
jgi:CheY-like chemotaxis protein